MREYQSFTTAYVSTLMRLAVCGKHVSPRGLGCLELIDQSWRLLDATKDRIDFSETGLPERAAIYTEYCNRELEWYRSGALSALSAPSKFWQKLANEHGEIVSNYGFMVLHDKQYQGKTGFEHVVGTLRADPWSRQAILHYSLPKHCFPGNKDVPCTISAQVLIRDSKLHMIVMQRSCDVWYGLAYDVPWHCWLIRELAHTLNVQPGVFTHHIGSLHVYDPVVPTIKKVIGPKYEPATSSI